MTSAPCPVSLTSPLRSEIDALAYEDLLSRYAVGIENFDRRLFQLTPEQADTAFLPEAGVGRWPARVLVGHLADAELAYTHRFRRALAEDNPVESPWDENAFIDAGLYTGFARPALPLAGSLAMVHTLRKWSLDLLAQLSPEQLARRTMHPEFGERTVRDIVVTATWHMEHHASFLNRKISRMLGPAPAPSGEPCGPRCGCHHGA